CARAGNDYDDW
nr:immunoglobulin heavy chain junction region [Mus musculus]